MTNELKMAVLLGEAKSLILQLYARGDFVSYGATNKQVNDICTRITALING